jgi:hypothetical protein
MHAHAANVVVFLTDGKVNLNSADGQTSEASFKVGEARWANKEKHLPENPADKASEGILIELK